MYKLGVQDRRCFYRRVNFEGSHSTGPQWLMPKILAPQEAMIRRIVV
jgi:hypothetical protein